MVAAPDNLAVSLDDWAARDRAARLRLFVPEARTRAASTRLALAHALRCSVDPALEPTVRDARAQFWSEEIARLAEGRARHPLTLALQSLDPPFNFRALAAALAALQTAAVAPDMDPAPMVDALCELEANLWFDASAPDARACRIRALCDIVEWVAGPRPALKPQHFDTTVIAELRASFAADAWSAARREQILRSPGVAQNGGIASRMRERLDAWAIWRAVRATRRRRNFQSLTGADSGH